MIRVMIGRVYRYQLRVLIVLSILLNVMLGGRIHQSFSARNWDLNKRGRPNLVKVIDTILGKDHCVSSWVHWKLRER